MKTLYMVKYGCGQWEDYHEDMEYMSESFDFPRILGLFDDNMQEKLLLYAEAVEHVDSISIFDNEWDNPHHFMSVYEWLDDGSMKWIDAFGSEKLQEMSCLKRN